jgi:hypothetical protein
MILNVLIETITALQLRLGKNTWGIDTGIDSTGIIQVLLSIDTIDTGIDSFTAFYPAPFNFYSLHFSHLTSEFHLDHTLKMSSLHELDSSFIASAASVELESTITSQSRK